VKRTILVLCKRAPLMAAALAATLTACTSQQSQIATVNITRITQNWPKFINYNNQLASDTDAIQRSSASAADKQRQLDGLRQHFVKMQQEVTNDVRAAAEQVANQRHFKLVITHEFVGYGGTDITPDVEKILKITEKSPSP
jgi:Skp family chaperone for outer membrane proteins